MTRRLSRFRVAAHGAVVALLCLATAVAAAGAAELPAAYFPADAATPTDAEGWATLAAAFPHRLEAAASGAPRLVSPPATRLATRSGVDYVRVRRLGDNLATLAAALETEQVVIDLRYVRGDFAESLQFAQLLARHPLQVEIAGAGGAGPIVVEPTGRRKAGQRSVILVNRATAGPLEALLDALQAAGDVLLVGTPTAGDTGYFPDSPAGGPQPPDWRVIGGDFRRAGGPSLLDVGATPGLLVESPPADEEAAYLALDAGTPIGELLDVPVEKPRFDEARLLREHTNGNSRPAPTPAPPPVPNGNNPPSPGPPAPPSDVPAPAAAAPATAGDPPRPPYDRALHRAINTLVALSVLRNT